MYIKTPRAYSGVSPVLYLGSYICICASYIFLYLCSISICDQIICFFVFPRAGRPSAVAEVSIDPDHCGWRDKKVSEMYEHSGFTCPRCGVRGREV